MSISFKDVSKIYGDQPVVDRLTLEILDGEFFVLLGGSGSGKTTALRMIAGLVTPDLGEILLQGEVVNHISPQERNVGFVFQNYSLFRHMTVAENIGFGLLLRRVASKERKEKINQLLELIGLPDFGDRYPSQLSGGQQQRVAVARALAYAPQVLLLDEPFGALDLKTRVQLRRSLKKIHHQLGVTTVLVTHDQGDAFELGDRIGVMDRGKLLSIGPPMEVYQHPKSEYVAQFLGPANFFSGDMEEEKIQVGTTSLPLPEGMAPPEKGARVQVLIRPEQFELAETPEALHGTFLGEGEVCDLLFGGSFHRVTIRIPGLVRSATGGFTDGDPALIYAQIGIEKEKTLSFRSGLKVAVGVISFHIMPHQGLRILVGIDGSPHAEYALGFAAAIAKLTQGALAILGVAERFLEEKKAREGLSRAVQETQKDLQEVTSFYRRNHAVREILTEAEKNRYDLIVLGTRGRRGMARLLGSTASRVATLSPSPTLLVPRPFQSIQKVLICIAGDKVRKPDIRFAGRLARSAGATVTLFHVQGSSAQPPSPYLNEIAQILSNLGVEVQIKIGEGNVVEAILKVADQEKHDLLVLGIRAGKLRKVALAQSVTRRVLLRMTQPALVFKIPPPT